MLNMNDVEPDEIHILCYACKRAARMEMRRNAYRVPWGNMKDKDALKDLSLEGRLILGIKQKAFEGKNQIHPALGRDNQWALANTIINFDVGDFLFLNT
jgi:hypothetical protein